MAKSEEDFKEAIAGKKFPILTLDNKWHKLFTQNNQDKETKKLVDKLNELIARQGGLNQDIKDTKKLKTKLMSEIVSGMDGRGMTPKDMDDHKRLINECNEKINACQDELLDLPRKIDQINYRLMIKTMSVCYEVIQKNTEEINSIGAWISQVRVELKKNVIRKQEKEYMNKELYSYMHDIFGPDVIDIFDMKYEEENMMKKPSDSKETENL